MNVPDKVTTTGLNGGHPFQNLKNENIQRQDSSQSLFASTTSTVEITISGRVVFKPIRK